MENLGKHEARHDLPISNGYSSHTGPNGSEVAVHCGRCKGYFTPDEAWANRYYDAKVRGMARGGFDPFEWRGFTEEENAKALEGIEADRRRLLSMLAGREVAN